MKKLNKNFVIVFVLIFVLGLSGPMALFAAGPLGVNLGSSNSFAILAKTGISTTGSTSIVGDVGISPAAASYITGFALALPAGGAFSTSSLVNGKVYAPGYADPTPANMSVAVSNMETAYTDAMGRTNPTATELGAGNIGGMTLAPGLYKWSTGVTIPADVTLFGGANDVWIFQIAQNLNIGSAVKIVLSGGAQAGNIFWVVAGQATLGTTSLFNGNILDQTAIVLNTGATLNGRALAQTAVTLDGNMVTIPTGGSSNVIINSSGAGTTSTGGGLYPSGGTTGTVAQSSNPVTLQISPNVTMTTISPGCSGENKFNTSTGLPCVNNNTTITATGSFNFGTATLKNGSRGAAVMELQRFLNKFLNLGLAVDGKLGPKTIAVIKKWQKDHGLLADGLIGTKTKAMMNAEAGNGN